MKLLAALDWRYAVKQCSAAKIAEQKQQWALQQAYIALGHFLTCAAMMKIDSCHLAGFDYDQIVMEI